MKISTRLASVMIVGLSMANVALAQRTTIKSLNWFYPSASSRDVNEKGDINELKDKHRVVVSLFAFADLDTNVLRAGLEQQVKHDLKKYSGFEIVSDSKEADFAIRIEAAISKYGGQCKYYVMTRGTKTDDDSFNPRVLMERSTTINDCQLWTSQRIASLVHTVKQLRGEH